MVRTDTSTGSRTMNEENVEESVLLIQKIKVLLLPAVVVPVVQPSRTMDHCEKNVNEQQLVALLLLTRVQHDDEFVRTMMMESCYNVIIKINVQQQQLNLVELSTTTSDSRMDPDADDHHQRNQGPTTSTVTASSSSSSSLHVLIARLVTQLLHRLYRALIITIQQQQQQYSYDVNVDNYNLIMESLMIQYATVRTTSDRELVGVPAVMQRYELLVCIQFYIQYLYERNSNDDHYNTSNTTGIHDITTAVEKGTSHVGTTVDSILDVMWKLIWYDTDDDDCSIPTTPPSSSTVIPDRNNGTVNNEDENRCSRKISTPSSTGSSYSHMTSFGMMEQTITTLLNESSCCCCNVETSDDNNNSNNSSHLTYKHWYNKMIQCLLQCSYNYFEVQQMALLQQQQQQHSVPSSCTTTTTTMISRTIVLPSFFTIVISEWLQQHQQQHQRPSSGINNIQSHDKNETMTKQEKSSVWAYLLLSILFRYCHVQTMINTSDESNMPTITKSSIVQPWTSIQLLLFSCIVTIDDRLYENDTDGDLLWLPHDHTQQVQQCKRPKTLRTMAWSCIAVMFVAMGLESTWINDDRIDVPDTVHEVNHETSAVEDITKVTTNNQYGKCKNLCTLLRLAAGEWKIQLTMIIDQLTTTTIGATTFIPNESPPREGQMKNAGNNSNNNPSSKWMSSSDWRIVESIAETLIATVAYLVQLTDSDFETRNTTLPNSNAIQHLQKSLTEAHIVSIQYLQLVKCTNRNMDNVVFIDRCVIRVFATLTADIISFTPIQVDANQLTNPTDYGVAGPSTVEQLDALYVVMGLLCNKHSRDTGITDFESFRIVFLCVMNVLASAHGTTEHVSMIIESKIIGDIFVSFVALFLRCCDSAKDSSHSETMGWLCDVIEETVELRQKYHGDGCDRNQYQTMMIDYLKQKLVLYDTKPDIVPSDGMVLRRMADCYITLQGTASPSLGDSIIIQQILQL